MFEQPNTDLINISVKSHLRDDAHFDTKTYDLTHKKKWSLSQNDPINANTTTFPNIQYKFPHYFSCYYKITHFILLAPFKARTNQDGHIEITTSTINHVISASIFLACWILSVLQLRIATSKRLKDDPEKLFSLSNYLCWSVYVIVFANLVWSKNSYEVLKLPAVPVTFQVSK